MTYAGFVLLMMVVVVMLVMIPSLIDRTTAISLSRENDRFSPRIRLIEHKKSDESADSSSQVESSAGHGSHTISLLGATTTKPLSHNPVILTSRAGDTMAMHQTSSHDSPAYASNTNFDGDHVYELARLRARRAARLSQENAAGRRRMFVCMITAMLFLIFASLCALTPLSWGWVSVPAILFAGAMTVSRMAAVRIRRVGEAEESRIRELAEHSDRLTRMYALGNSTKNKAAESLSLRDISAVNDKEEHAHQDSDVCNGELLDSTKNDSVSDLTQVSEGHANLADVRGEDEQQMSSESGNRGTWDVEYAPVSSYANRARVTGRTVHADTDLRGIPLIDGAVSVPARPQKVSMNQRLRSTEDVVAAAPIVFDLDEVLELRRNVQ